MDKSPMKIQSGRSKLETKGTEAYQISPNL